jgi:nucleotide-binding universal stress UspA family protein
VVRKEGIMITQILAALDGSEPASRAAAMAVDLAVKHGATLHLVNVVPRLVLSESLKQVAAIEGVDNPLTLQVAGAAQSFLGSAQASAAGKGVDKIVTEVLIGDPATQLLDYARDRGIDLIVLGRRGAGQIRGLLMGSVSSKVASLAECPVLTVH